MRKSKNQTKYGVGVIILNNKDEILLGKRGPHARNYQFHWDLIGGQKEEKESFLEAVARETFEETGLHVASKYCLNGIEETNFTGDWISYTYIARILRGTLELKEPRKIMELKYFPLQSLPEPLTKSTELILGHYRQYLATKEEFNRTKHFQMLKVAEGKK